MRNDQINWHSTQTLSHYSITTCVFTLRKSSGLYQASIDRIATFEANRRLLHACQSKPRKTPIQNNQSSRDGCAETKRRGRIKTQVVFSFMAL